MTTPGPWHTSHRQAFDLRIQPVEGPKGPHLFRSSQVSNEFDFEFALQMSPLFPKKEQHLRPEPTPAEDVLTPVGLISPGDFSIAAAVPWPLLEPNETEAEIRTWTTQQVIDWMYESGIDSPIIECFDIHDINGAVLLDLEFEDLKELDIPSFGKRHQLWSAICLLRGEPVGPSPQQTPFQDTSRPCTAALRRTPSRARTYDYNGDADARATTPTSGKKRRGRKPSNTMDVVTPAESVSIVAIEQLLPKPHNCAKGERCAKWRKQQKELQQLHDDDAVGRFPVSPTKGGRIFVRGDPGNANTADNMIANVHKQLGIPTQPEDALRPTSEVVPSVVASSDLLGPGQLPEFALQEDTLSQLGSRDPQDNVKQFLTFQHMNSPAVDDAPPSPPLEMFPANSFSAFPASRSQTYPQLQPPRHTPGPHEQLRSLPKLQIPRSASAGPQGGNVMSPETANMVVCRSATASPGQMLRTGTPASEVDIPLTAVPIGPVARDTSQSVPPNMQYRHSNRVQSRHQDWRRPSMALPALKEGEVLSPRNTVRDPAHHSPETKYFGYGEDCTHAGWMKKRKTKMLRHEWQDAHFRLKGTQLAMHSNARFSTAATDTIDVDEYAVACSSAAAGSKLSAAMKALSIKNEAKKRAAAAAAADPTTFAFQLIPAKDGTDRKIVASGKTHHFAVKSKDERIDWMREIMLAKALQQKDKGYEVEVNGVQA